MILLYYPHSQSMRDMLKICDVYANDYSIVVNAKNSKCILFKLFVISYSLSVLNPSLQSVVILLHLLNYDLI